MKNLLIISVLILFSNSIIAQESTDSDLSKNEQKEIKKELQEKELQEQLAVVLKNVVEKSFVFKADYITFKTQRDLVDHKLNFVLVDSTFSVLQIGTGTSVGFNGLGGSTAKGEIISYKFTKNEKRKSIYLNMSVNTMAGQFYVIFDISANRNATATISCRSWSLLYEGKIVNLEKADIYKGDTTY